METDFLLLVCIGLGGALGSVCRYLAAAALKGVWGHHFPWEMIFVNTLGCVLIGFFASYLYVKLPHPRWAAFSTAGVLSGALPRFLPSLRRACISFCMGIM